MLSSLSTFFIYEQKYSNINLNISLLRLFYLNNGCSFFQHFLCILVGNLQKPLSLVAESIIKLAKYLINANEHV